MRSVMSDEFCLQTLETRTRGEVLKQLEDAEFVIAVNTDAELKHASSTYTWPEAFHPITKGGCMGEGHHGWAAAEWVLLLRNLLFYERGDKLCLTPLISSNDMSFCRNLSTWKN